MNCLIEFCFITAIYFTGAVGAQPHPIDTFDYSQTSYAYTNGLGRYIGEASVVVEFGDRIYIEAKHISGLNVAEHDGGLNALMIGTRIDFFTKGK